MSRRNVGGDKIANAARFLEKLRPAREAVIDELRALRPNTPHYYMVHVILAAIDTASEFLSGHRYYFLNPNPDVIGANCKPDAGT